MGAPPPTDTHTHSQQHKHMHACTALRRWALLFLADGWVEQSGRKVENLLLPVFGTLLRANWSFFLPSFLPHPEALATSASSHKHARRAADFFFFVNIFFLLLLVIVYFLGERQIVLALKTKLHLLRRERRAVLGGVQFVREHLSVVWWWLFSSSPQRNEHFLPSVDHVAALTLQIQVHTMN